MFQNRPLFIYKPSKFKKKPIAMNIFDLNDNLPENPIMDLLKQLEGKTIEYSEGLKTTITVVNQDGSVDCDPAVQNKDKFTKYINGYLNNHIKFK